MPGGSFGELGRDDSGEPADKTPTLDKIRYNVSDPSLDTRIRIWHLGMEAHDGSKPTEVDGKRVVALAAGGSHTIALVEGGQAWAWGSNSLNELGDGTNTKRSTPVQVRLPGKKFVAIAAGRSHTIALVEGGEVWAWGCNAGRQLGDGTKFDRAVPVQVRLPPQKFVAIAASRREYSDGSFALSEGGECWTWGYTGGLDAPVVPFLTQKEVPEELHWDALDSMQRELRLLAEGSWRYAAEGL